MSLVSAPSLSGYAREFDRCLTPTVAASVSMCRSASIPRRRTFLYDVWVNLADPSGGVANLGTGHEPGDAERAVTVIYGLQCDGYSGTWDYTANAGSTVEAAGRLAAFGSRVQSTRVVYEFLAPHSGQLFARPPRQRHLQVDLAR